MRFAPCQLMTVELWERNNVSELLVQGYTSQHSGAAGMNMAPFNHEAGVRLYKANTYVLLVLNSICYIIFRYGVYLSIQQILTFYDTCKMFNILYKS